MLMPTMVARSLVGRAMPCVEKAFQTVIKGVQCQAAYALAHAQQHFQDNSRLSFGLQVSSQSQYDDQRSRATQQVVLGSAQQGKAMLKVR